MPNNSSDSFGNYGSPIRRSTSRRGAPLPAGWDLLSNADQAAAAHYTGLGADIVSNREQGAMQNAFSGFGIDGYREMKGKNAGKVRPEYQALAQAGTIDEQRSAMDGLQRLQDQARAKMDAAAMKELRTTRSRLRTVKTFHDQALKSFDKGDGKDLLMQPDGAGGIIDVGPLAGQIADLERRAQERVGVIKGALTPGIEAGDFTDDAKNAQMQLPALKQRQQLLMEKRNRIAGERDRVAAAYRDASASYANMLADQYGINRDPSGPLFGGDIPTDRGGDPLFARTQVDDTRQVSPAELVQLHAKMADIDETMKAGAGNLAPRVIEGLQAKKQQMMTRFTDGFIQLPDALKQRVTDATRDPTLWEKAQEFGANLAQGAGDAITDTLEFGARNNLRLFGQFSDSAAQKYVKEFADEMRNVAETWGPNVPPEVKAKLEGNFWTGDLAHGAGSTLAFMAPGVAVNGLGRLVGLAPRVLSALTTASVAMTGGASEANSFRREAEAGLRARLEKGEITPEDMSNGMKAAEGLGFLLGTTEAIPVASFAKRLSDVPAGKSFVRQLVTSLGEGGLDGAAKFVARNGRPLLKRAADVLGEGFEEALQEFGQQIGEEAIAQGRLGNTGWKGKGDLVTEEALRGAAAGGLSGLLFSAGTNAYEGTARAARLRKLKEQRAAGGNLSRGGGEAGVENGVNREGPPPVTSTPPPLPTAAEDVPAEPQADAELAAALKPRTRRSVVTASQQVAPETPVPAGVIPGNPSNAKPGEKGLRTVPPPTQIAQTPAADVAGEKIDKEWTAFAPDSKSLGIPRADMPQVKAEARGAMVNFLKARGVSANDESVLPTELKPTQAEFSPAKVEKARKFDGGDRAILVSSDGHVVDGHHQWMAKLADKPGEPMRVIRLGAPIRDVLSAVKEMPSATTATGATEAKQSGTAETANPSAPDILPKTETPAVPESSQQAKAPAVATIGETFDAPRTPREFVARVSKAAKLKASSKQAKFLADFTRRLHTAAPQAFESMKVVALDDTGWRANEALKSRTPDSSAAFDQSSNTLYLHTGRLNEENIASAIVHESGHFAEKFYLGEDFTQREWEKLTHEQRVEARRQYDGSQMQIVPDFLKRDRKSRAEWVAMQFARVVRGETNGMAPTLKAKLEKFLRDVRELVNKWVGDGTLTTPELDGKILEMLGYGKDVNQTPAAATQPAAPKPQEAAPANQKPAPKFTKIGTNSAGETIEEDDNGVRSVVNQGIRISESVALRPTRGGIEASVDDATRDQRFKPAAPKPAGGISAEADNALDTAFDGLLGTPSDYTQEGIPPEKIGNFVAAAQALIGSGVKTPEAMARILDEKFQRKARKYSQALWNAFGMVDPGLSSKPDWTRIYEAAAAAQPAPAPAPEAKPAEQPKPSESAPGKRDYAESVSVAADELGRLIKAGQKFDWRQLFEITDRAFGGTQAQGAYTVKDAYDALELAINRAIVSRDIDFQSGTLVGDTNIFKAREAQNILARVLEAVPTQTKRTEEQIAAQQFSTPPTLAFMANWVANLRPSDVYLEPSAGTGGLAAFGKAARVKRVIANELSQRRSEVLRESGVADTVLNMNAELLNTLLDPRIKSGAIERPTVVVMNPPFSNGAESGKRGVTMIGAKHVEESLKVLAPGGRLVAIVGEGMAPGKPTFNQWWERIAKQYAVRANVSLTGEDYRKYGTTFDNQILVIDKVAPDGKPVVTVEKGSLAKVGDLANLLAKVRDERPTEQSPAQPSSAVAPAQSGNASTSRGSVSAVQPDSQPARTAGRSARSGDRMGEQPGDAGASTGTAVRSDNAGRVGESQPAGGGESVGGGTDAGAESGLSVTKSAPHAPKMAANDDSVFAEYEPAKVKVEGAKPHPTPLVESAAMASVPPPDPKYTPNLPKEVVANGELSDAQVENIVYAGQAHADSLPSGERGGYMIGDGTGVGKGRQIAGIIIDNWRRGRRKAVWISKTGLLINDARRDFRDLGGDDSKIIDIGKAAKAKVGSITLKDGIVFSTYTSLGNDHEGLDSNGKLRPSEKRSRVQQLVEWLGPDFDGVIAFDESHMAGNAVTSKGTRGFKKPSKAGIAVVDLQRLLPKARILYVSATGATEPSNLSYADRLGVWGPGAPFSSKQKFFEEISAGGVSAMEIVARDLKAMGRYMARTLSFKGVVFDDKSVHQELTPEQRGIYNELARGWQVVFQNVDAAMGITDGKKNAMASSAAKSRFWGVQQRFFNQVITSMQMPAILDQLDKDIAAGNAAVLQLVNTNEATQDREIARKTTEEAANLDELDLSPKDILLQYVNNSFPTTKYQEVADPNNTERTMWVPVIDEQGNPVQDPEAIALKQETLEKISLLRVPDNPLEQILGKFGPDAVAEITGRGQRVVRKEVDGEKKTVIERRTEATRRVESQEFQDGKRRILVFSAAGGTGFSYHASRKAKNQQLRVHYLVQAGWRADAALQGFGRTHRSDQAQPPLYKLVTTDIHGHKRFISTIARRLAQLGALTAGERKSTGQGLFKEEDNLESKYAHDALVRFFHDLHANRIAGLDMGSLSKKMGFGKTVEGEWKPSLIEQETGDLNEEKLPSIQQFLNRILALEVDDQNQVFGEFFKRMQRRIENAKIDDTYDPGMQNYNTSEHLTELNKVSDEVVYTHPESGAQTRIVEAEAVKPRHVTSFDEVMQGEPVIAFVRNKKSGNVYAIKDSGGATRTTESGDVVEQVRRYGTHTTELIGRNELQRDTYERLTNEQAKPLWEQEAENTEKVSRKHVHFIVGTFLPIWDRIKISNPRIFRFTTSNGETLLGALVPEKQVPAVKKRLGAKASSSPESVFKSVIDAGTGYELANGWRVRRVTLSGQPRIEITGADYAGSQEIKNYIGYKMRLFLPTDEKTGVEAFTKLLKKSPIAEVLDENTVLGTPAETGTTEDKPTLSPPKNAKVPGQPGHRYRSHPDSLILAGIETARQVYKTRGNVADDATAKEIIKQLGESVAAELSMDSEADLPGAVKTAIAVNLQHTLNKRRFNKTLTAEERRAAQRMSDRLAQVKAEQFTDMGQAIQFLSRLNDYNEDGVLEAARRGARQRQEKTLGEQGTKAVDEAAQAVQAENEKAIDAATEDLQRALRAVRVGKSIWRRYQDFAARRWLKRIEAALNGGPEEMPPMMEFTNRLVREVQNKIDEALPPQERPPQRTPIEIIQEAVANREKYKEAWDRAAEAIAQQYEGKPDVLEKLDDALSGVLDQPYSTKTVDRAIREAHKEMEVSVRDLARMHYRQADAFGQSLAAKLVERTGLKAEDADRLANLVRDRVKAATAEAKKKALARLAAQKTGAAKRVFGTADKLIELSNLGAFTKDEYFSAVAEALKLPRLTEEQAEKLRAMAEKAQATPEGFQRDRVMTDMLSELQKIRGVGPLDVATAIYYSHILSGYTTQAVNTLSTALNVAADVTTLIARHPTTAIEAMRGLRDGAATGFAQAMSILDTGYAHRHFDEKLPEVAPIIESLAKDGDRNAVLRNYAKLLRYIGRAMKASDAVFFYSASEAYQRVAAAKLAAEFEDGKLSWKDRAAKVRDILAMHPAEFEAARRQAKAEGLTGLDYQLRVGEIVRQKRNPEVAAAGKQFGLMATFNNEPRGYMGVAARAIRDASEKFPPLRLFVPFTNIVSNVANASFNYSPVGVVRAFRGYGGETAPASEERDALLIKGIAGSMGLLYLLAYGMGDGDDDKTPWITGTGPTNTAARNQLRETGWKPHTVKIGGAYVSYLETPLAIPLAIVGNYIDGVKYNGLSHEDGATRVGKALTSVPETIVSMSFLRGLADFMDAARGRKDWGEIAGNVAGAAVPNLVQQVDRTFDPTIYETDGVAGLVAGRVPGIRQTFPEKLKVTGQPVESRPLERFGRAETNDDLWRVLAEKQAWIPEAGKDTKIGKQTLTPEQYREYVQISGPAIEQRLRASIARLKAMTPEQADEFVQKVVREERAKAKPRLRREFVNPFPR